MKLDLLDSSGWLECLDAGLNTVHFSPVLFKLPTLLIPSTVITEVRKVASKQRTSVPQCGPWTSPRAALESGASILCSENLQHERSIEHLRIINPFLTNP
jgi:hypothetical protein